MTRPRSIDERAELESEQRSSAKTLCEGKTRRAGSENYLAPTTGDARAEGIATPAARRGTRSGAALRRSADRRIGLEERYPPGHEPRQPRNTTHRFIEWGDGGERAGARTIRCEQRGRRNAHRAESGSQQSATNFARRERAVMLVTLAGAPAHVAVRPPPRNEAHTPHADV